jgi:hypothetical protein
VEEVLVASEQILDVVFRRDHEDVDAVVVEEPVQVGRIERKPKAFAGRISTHGQFLRGVG